MFFVLYSSVVRLGESSLDFIVYLSIGCNCRWLRIFLCLVGCKLNFLSTHVEKYAWFRNVGGLSLHGLCPFSSYFSIPSLPLFCPFFIFFTYLNCSCRDWRLSIFLLASLYFVDLWFVAIFLLTVFSFIGVHCCSRWLTRLLCVCKVNYR